MAKQAVTVQEEPKALATMDPELAAMLVQDVGLGQEAFTAKDMALPRLSILQPLSPQVTPGKPEYNESFKPGMIYDSVLNKAYSGEKGIVVVPASYRSALLEWIPRKAGGGFVADHGTDETILSKCKPAEDNKNQMLTPEGHEVIRTAEYFSYLIDEAGVLPVIISMAKTQHRKARVWNTLINQFEIPHPADPSKTINPAMFYRSYLMRTQLETNDQGSWFGWKIEPHTNTLDLPRGKEIYLKARKLHADVAAGVVKAAPPVEMNAAEDENTPM